MFMYVEQDKPRYLLPLPQNVLHTHLLKSAYHVVVNGELVLYKESQELLPSQVRRMDEEPPSALNPPHKWAKEIKAWADGHTIQMRNKVKNGFRDEEDPEEFHYSAWIDQKNPGWWYDSGVTEYRVKPNVDAH
jgi:hypothetical protein